MPTLSYAAISVCDTKNCRVKADKLSPLDLELKYSKNIPLSDIVTAHPDQEGRVVEIANLVN